MTLAIISQSCLSLSINRILINSTSTHTCMDRSELEELIARTMQKPANAPLSPKQHFQWQVRGLAAQPRHTPARPEPGAASASHRCELRHVSTLRVQHH